MPDKTSNTSTQPSAPSSAPFSPDKSHRVVQTMFSDIAPSYDLLNHLLSARQDVIWRKRAIGRLVPRRDETILDLCCGTGDLSLEIVRQQPGCKVIGADFALPMLQIAHDKAKKLGIPNPPQWVEADGLQLPFEDNTFDALTVAFGVRNFEDTCVGLHEMRRVLKPGGRLMILEFMRPTSLVLQRFFGLFNAAFAPLGRAVSGHNSAYNYLPQSIGGFYTRGEFANLLRQEGFANVRSFDHSLGIATSFLAKTVQ